jgi:hypothetical protein
MKQVFKIIIIASVAIGCLFLVGCDGHHSVNSGPDVDNTNFMAEADFLFPIEVADQSRLRLEGVSGSISFTGRADSESVEDAEEHLTLLDVGVHEMSDEINVRTIQPDEAHGRNYEVIYNIILPDNFVILTTNVNGAITVDSISNDITINNVNGHIGLDEIAGNVSVNLVNGQISGNVILPLDGLLILSTVNGQIALDIPQATSSEFLATVVNGNISISALDLQNEVITNTSVRGTLGDGDGHITLSAVNGNITVGGF